MEAKENKKDKDGVDSINRRQYIYFCDLKMQRRRLMFSWVNCGYPRTFQFFSGIREQIDCDNYCHIGYGDGLFLKRCTSPLSVTLAKMF